MPVANREDGKFIRTRAAWTPNEWDNGYIDSRGYFRVYRPDYPNAWDSGYAKRYWIVYWLATGHVQQDGEDLHHKNENKTDDRLENLELISHGDHSALHKPRPRKVCKGCGNEFVVPPGKISRKRKYCSQSCYHKTPRSDLHKRRISEGLIDSYQEGIR